MSGILYKLDFASGKSYIGVTRCSLLARLRQHRHLAGSGSGQAVHSAWRKYGAPVASVLAIVESAVLDCSERRAIVVFRTLAPHGYNLTDGGDTAPSCMPEVRKKISAALTGLKRSAETKERISMVQRGTTRSKEHRAKIARTMLGKKFTEEHKQKIGDANRGRDSANWRGDGNPMRNHELVERLAAMKRGRPLSAEHCAKLCAAWVLRKARAT